MSHHLSDISQDLEDEDQIDDNEFCIPAIDGPLPTLDSIFNEEDNDSIGSDPQLEANEVTTGLNEWLESTENSSLSSYDSKGPKKSSKYLLPNESYPKLVVTNGSVIRHSVLKTISAQIKSADTERIGGGKPTVMK
ncbi:unnamed protein product, partial [Oppiella nova]